MALAGLSLRDIEYVVAVADAGGFTAAAAACGVAQPSLSAQVRKVEDRLGVVVFERTGREVRITAAGRLVVEQARIVLSEARRLFELARGVHDPLAGVLRLGAIASLGPYLIPHLLGPMRDGFPSLQLYLTEGLTAELTASVIRGELDAVLLSLPIDDPRIACESILFEPFVGVCSTRSLLAGKRMLGLDDLDTDELILMEEGHCIRAQALALCTRGTANRSRRHAASIETLRHLVAAGAGHSLLPLLAAKADPLLDPHLRYTPFADARIGRTIGLAFRATDPRAQSFRRLARFIAEIEIPGTRPEA